jgi:hypothetical protein
MPILSNPIPVLLAEDVHLNTLLLLLSPSPSPSSFSSISSDFPEFGNRACESSSNFQFYLTTFFGRGDIVFGSNYGLGFEEL